MDRQELRLVFERGDVTLYDWVPTRARIHAIADEAADARLVRLVPGRAARRLGELFAARTAPARAATRRSTSTR